MHDLRAGRSGAHRQPTHGLAGRLRRLGQRREHREVADDAALALDEEDRELVGVAHDVGVRYATTPDTLRSMTSSVSQPMAARISSQCSLNSGARLGVAGSPAYCTGAVTIWNAVPSAVAVSPR